MGPQNTSHLLNQILFYKVLIKLNFMEAIASVAGNLTHVFWGQLLHRPASRIGHRDYSEKIHHLNKLIMAQESHSFHYWSHKGVWNVAESLYSTDGIHFHSRGHQQLGRSICGAILRFLELSAVKSMVVVPAESTVSKRLVEPAESIVSKRSVWL